MSSSTRLRGNQQSDLTAVVISAIVLGLTVGNVVFYSSSGVTPETAMGRVETWWALAVCGFVLAIAVRERGLARVAFVIWALHYALVALTPVGEAGWGPFVTRTAMLVVAAGLLLSSTLPLPDRHKRLGVAILVIAVAFAAGTKWASWQMMRRSRQVANYSEALHRLISENPELDGKRMSLGNG